MFLNLKDLRRIRDAAALWGHPPRAYRQFPPALLGCLRLRSQSALLRLIVAKVSEAERFAGD
ncbi:hypothetical protein BBW69_03705 [Neisseria sp. RH3002v2f]|nr:hypothetical protein [Neisseria sp. RH3002v2f]MBD0764372.1 hypothetical protein [Neisseria sp. RH3002v2f]